MIHVHYKWMDSVTCVQNADAVAAIQRHIKLKNQMQNRKGKIEMFKAAKHHVIDSMLDRTTRPRSN